MSNHSKTRDVGIEAARIFACLIVIGIHVCLSYNPTGTYDLSILYVTTLFADGVTIFWIISGCFMFNHSSYTRKLKHTFKTIFIPALLLSIWCLYFYNWLIDDIPLHLNISLSLDTYKYIIYHTLCMNVIIPGTGHLWFCNTYILIALIYPALYTFVRYLEEDNKRTRIFLIMSLLLFIYNDFFINQFAGFSQHGINALVPSAIYIIWGHIIYHHKKHPILSKKPLLWIILSPLCFLLTNYVRTFTVAPSGTYTLSWCSSFAFINAIFVLIFFISLGNYLEKISFIHSPIYKLASYTFPIYLVHFPLVALLKKHQLDILYYNYLSPHFSGSLLAFIYDVCMILTVFLICLIIAVVLRLLKNSVVKCIHCFKK